MTDNGSLLCALTENTGDLLHFTFLVLLHMFVIAPNLREATNIYRYSWKGSSKQVSASASLLGKRTSDTVVHEASVFF